MKITVISISKSGKSAFISLSKKTGVFISTVKGFIQIDPDATVAKDDTFDLPEHTKYTLSESVSEEDPSVKFTWISFL